MSDWLSALRAAPSAPSELLDFAATQPSLEATWRNATRGDWIVWMAANGFGGNNSPRDVVDAAAILADYARGPTWRLAFRLRANDEDVVRRLAALMGDFDLTQLVAHVYLGCAVGSVAGTMTYARLVGRSILVRERGGAVVLVAFAVVVSVVAYRIWSRSLKRIASGAAAEQAIPAAVAVAARASLRSDVMKQVASARLMRKRLSGAVASSDGT